MLGIHAIRIFLYRLFKSTTTQRRARVIDSVGVYTTKRYRQPYTVAYNYTVYNVYYILLVKELPKVPGVAARMGFEPTTFRSKGIESKNVPQILIGNCKKNYYMIQCDCSIIV